MDLWTSTDNGFCTEASDLKATDKFPNTNKLVCAYRAMGFMQEHKRNGEITHWTTTIDGVEYTIFND